MSPRSKPFMLNVEAPAGTVPVVGWEGLYQVSRDGRIWTFPKRGHRGKWMALKVGTHGYLTVNLHRDRERRCLTVHRLVAKAFIPNPDGKPQVNHKDGNRANSAASNLEWVTSAENHRHAIRIGLRGRSPLNKLTEQQIAGALERRRRGDLLGPIAASLGVSESTISRFTSKELSYG
jgi:hypothetical protein